MYPYRGIRGYAFVDSKKMGLNQNVRTYMIVHIESFNTKMYIMILNYYLLINVLCLNTNLFDLDSFYLIIHKSLIFTVCIFPVHLIYIMIKHERALFFLFI
jgi:hypothetical protein